MIEKFTELLMKWCEKYNRVIKITGTAGPDDVYLIRYYVVRSKYFNFFIHQFLRSDRDDLHDHPWHFMTYLVRGHYTEYKWNSDRKEEDIIRRSHNPYYPANYKKNALVFRKATDQHKVVVDFENKEKDKGGAPLTICITGPVIREWGFVKSFKPIIHNDRLIKKASRIWVPWRKYLGLPDDAPGRG